jgi:vesicle-associated membrane protein 7
MNGPNIKYVLLGNTSTGVIMAELVVTKNQQTQIEAKQIFEKMSKLTDKRVDERGKIQGKNNETYYFTHITPTVFVLLLAASTYQERHAFELIDTINKDNVHLLVETRSGELNGSGKQTLKAIVDKYQDVKNISAIQAIENDVKDIQLEMNTNIRKIVTNVEDVKQLDHKAEKIKQGADTFKRDAKTLERVTWWQNFKLTIIIATIVVGLILIIVLPLVLRS